MVYSLRGSVRRISIHSIAITSQSCNSCPSSLSSQHTSTHKATHRTEKMQHQYPSDTPDTPDTPATGKGLWRVAKSVPLPLPPPYPSPNPGGFENPCPSLLVSINGSVQVRTMVQWFNIKRDLLNPGLNYWFSSGQKPNLEPNLGSVRFGSGSNHGSELSLTITKLEVKAFIMSCCSWTFSLGQQSLLCLMRLLVVLEPVWQDMLFPHLGKNEI